MRALSCIRGNKVFELEVVVLLQPRSSLFHVPNGFTYYVAQDIRQMLREQGRETVYSPICKASGAPVNNAMQGAQKSLMFN